MTGTLVFDPLIPWAILTVAGVLSLAAVILAAWRGLAGWALRALAAVVIVAALTGPAYQLEDRAALSDIVVMLEDESSSQSLSDRPDQTLTAADELAQWIDAHPDCRVLVCAETAGRREAVLGLMQKAALQPQITPGWAQFAGGAERCALTVGQLDRGFYSPQHQLLVIAESQLYGERIMQRRRRSSDDSDPSEQAFRSLGELTRGSPVVHIDHGVGRYLGLETITVEGEASEFLMLEYAGGSKLYVPVSSLHLISRYAGNDTEHAPLHKLGTDRWSTAKQKALEKIRDTAAELLDVFRELFLRHVRDIVERHDPHEQPERIHHGQRRAVVPLHHADRFLPVVARPKRTPPRELEKQKPSTSSAQASSLSTATSITRSAPAGAPIPSRAGRSTRKRCSIESGRIT